VEHGGDGLQLWIVTVNILKKDSQIDGNGCFSSLAGERSQTSPYHKELACSEVLHRVSYITGYSENGN
jgi:hypothetical protein